MLCTRLMLYDMTNVLPAQATLGNWAGNPEWRGAGMGLGRQITLELPHPEVPMFS